MTEEPRCPNCGCEFKTKYMIRVDHDYNDPKAKRHLESRTKKSIVGWIKHMVDNFRFEEITIYNMLTECPTHKEHWEKKGEIQCNKQSATPQDMTSESLTKAGSDTQAVLTAIRPPEKLRKEDNHHRETS